MAMDGPDKPSETEDLTQLSLEQLLKLDLVGIDVLGSHTHAPGEIMVGYRSDPSAEMLVERSLQQVLQLAREKRISMRTELDTDLPLLRGRRRAPPDAGQSAE